MPEQVAAPGVAERRFGAGSFRVAESVAPAEAVAPLMVHLECFRSLASGQNSCLVPENSGAQGSDLHQLARQSPAQSRLEPTTTPTISTMKTPDQSSAYWDAWVGKFGASNW